VGDRAEVMESYRVGSVAWADKYFPQGRLRAEEFDSAIVAAKAVLDEAAVHFIAHSVAPQVAVYGSAGTIGAIAEILVASGRSQGVIDLAGLRWLRMQMQSFAQIQTLDMPGLKEDRKPVLGGGLSVLIALFELLGLTGMRVVDAGLRHGVLHDLIDRELPGTDVREQSALRLAKRFGIDALQAQRVEEAATHLFEPMLAGSGEDASNTLRYRRKLSWAARLHEVGLTISHSDYHKHGAYIIDHTDALGFSQQELHRLSLLVLGHRGKLRKLEADFSDIRFVQQLICLRLGVLLCHARIQPSLKGLRLRCNAVAQRFEFSHSAAWAEKFPQSLHLLQHEQQAWLKTSWNLTIAAE
jgi:exopolyphosphatase / guanosine-5'-triphosphate,3'-diphosphate pyrophosphatase